MSWLLLAVIGGVVAIDATSFGQAMISRPIVAAPLIGFVLGDPGGGLVIGAMLEMFHLGILPIGAAKYPEAGTGAVAATWAYVMVAPEPGAGLLVAVVFALIWERLSGASVVAVRRLNDHVLNAGTPRPTPATVQVRHLAALTLDFARGVLVCVSGGAVGRLLVEHAAPTWPFDASVARGLLIVAGVAVAAGAFTVFGGWRERWRLFVVGAGGGLLLLGLT